MYLKFIIYLFILSIICSCSDAIENHEQARRLNDQAMEISFASIDTTDLIKALNLIDQAISIDSNYYLAYSNKIGILFNLERNTEVIKTLNRLVNFTGKNSFYYMTKGIAYQKMGNFDKSQINLKAAFDIASKLESDQDEAMYFHLLTYYEGKQAALSKLDEMRKAGNLTEKKYLILKETITYLDEDDILGINTY